MPAVRKEIVRSSTTEANYSRSGWDSWTCAERGGVIAASVLIFCFFSCLGIYLWKSRRGKGKDAAGATGRTHKKPDRRHRNGTTRTGSRSTRVPKQKRMEKENKDEKQKGKGAVRSPQKEPGSTDRNTRMTTRRDTRRASHQKSSSSQKKGNTDHATQQEKRRSKSKDPLREWRRHSTHADAGGTGSETGSARCRTIDSKDST